MTTNKLPVKALKMEKNIPFIPPYNAQHIIVFGCGGTGSAAIPHIARLAYAQKNIDITLIDGDTVEEKNLIRQNFTPADIGKNKAEVNATRYSAAFGIPISFRDEYLEKPIDIVSLLTKSAGTPLIVCCVDNIKTRASIKEAIAASRRFMYWVDCGNEDAAGQVVFSAHFPRAYDGTLTLKQSLFKLGNFPLPDVFELYPSLWEKLETDKFASELSCAELAVSNPQLGHVNLTAAVLAMNYIHALVVGTPIHTHAVEFSIKNKFAHRPLNASTIESWKTKCPIYKDFDLDVSQLA